MRGVPRPTLRLLAVAVAVATGSGCAAGSEGTTPGVQPTAVVSSPSPVTPTTPTTQPSTSHPAAPTTPTSPAPSATTPALLRLGATGAAVRALQQRLSALGYWLGTVDGVFGDTTQQAVYAVQKAAGLTRDGVVGPLTARALDRGVRPPVRPVTGSAIEVDIGRQLLLVVRDGRLAAILNTSTGGGYAYVENGATYVATTPTGRYAVTWRYDGWARSPLGWLWRPAYFVGGYAVHGYEEVPPYPASHGCVRVGIAAMNWLWDNGFVGLGTRVWLF